MASNEKLLITVADDDLSAASEALGWFMNSVFHQGQHEPSTALAVPKLLALLRPEVPARAEVLESLAGLVPGKEWNDLSPESHFWRSDLNDASKASVEAVRAGLEPIGAMLADVDVTVRCRAAWVLARLRSYDVDHAANGTSDPGSGPSTLLRARLAVERVRGATGAAGVEGDERLRRRLLQPCLLYTSPSPRD